MEQAEDGNEGCHGSMRRMGKMTTLGYKRRIGKMAMMGPSRTAEIDKFLLLFQLAPYPESSIPHILTPGPSSASFPFFRPQSDLLLLVLNPCLSHTLTSSSTAFTPPIPSITHLHFAMLFLSHFLHCFPSFLTSHSLFATSPAPPA